MGFNCGIVGLPNVGKSTLFNALTATEAAQAANFPFCTIEPNIGKVAVPDLRLQNLANLAKSAKIIPVQLEFVDIAGLVKGAAQGEGLGNQFLANIREVDAIVHVVRCFEHGDITHVEGHVDPLRDYEIIETELMLADLDSVERRLPPLQKKAKGGDILAKSQLDLMERAHDVLAEGRAVRHLSLRGEEAKLMKTLQLITSKPVMLIANVAEHEATTGNRFTQSLGELAKAQNLPMVMISAAIEAEVAGLADAELQKEYLDSLGLSETGLNQVVRAGYGLLGLISFFTVGPKEAHAWDVRAGATAPEAAGVIHSDFQRGFIAAETIACEDYLTLGGEARAREAGKLRLEGRDYIVKDGDVFHFRFNV